MYPIYIIFILSLSYGYFNLTLVLYTDFSASRQNSIIWHFQSLKHEAIMQSYLDYSHTVSVYCCCYEIITFEYDMLSTLPLS